MNKTTNFIIPSVTEVKDNTIVSNNVFSRLAEDRIIFIDAQIEPNIASATIATLLYLDAKDKKKPIHLYINSPGGVVNDGLGIIDIMHIVKAPVYTYVVGMAASMGSLILTSGEPGHRVATKHSTVMIHQVSGGTQGTIKDMEKRFAYSKVLQKVTNEILSKTTGKSMKEIEDAVDRDNFLSAEEAKKFGLIDKII